MCFENTQRWSFILSQRMVIQTQSPKFKSLAAEGTVINLATFSSVPRGWNKIDVPLISSLFKWDMYTNQITFHAL